MLNPKKHLMKTSDYATYQGPGRIAISRSVPRYIRSGYRVYRTLAPGPWFKSVSYGQYREKYFHQLSLLDPLQVWNALHHLAGDHEPVLLCYEKGPFDSGNFCHRRMVAEWFETELGFVVPEWSAA